MTQQPLTFHSDKIASLVGAYYPSVINSEAAREQEDTMRRLILSAFVAAMPMPALAGTQEDGQAVFEKFLSDFTAADPDAIASNFAPESLFWGTNSKDLIVSQENIRKYFHAAFKRLPGAKASQVGDVFSVLAAENVMVVSGVWQNDRLTDGKPVSTQARNALTLVKREGRWLIISFANSPRPK